VSLTRAANLLLLLQVGLGLRVAVRLLRTAGAERIRPVVGEPAGEDCVSVIVPVLNEQSRLQPCLDGLRLQREEVVEILVVDGGSTDGTPELVKRAALLDARIKLLQAGSIPSGWNGKAWGLEFGLWRTDRRANWLLTVDADVRPRAGLAAALLAQAQRTAVSALSVATLQEVAGLGTTLVHPAQLATLLYRYGLPGQATRRPAEALANGQCMLLERSALERIGGFAPAARSVCEDVTIARLLAAQGRAVGFYESDGLVSTRMYEGGAEAWRNWSRSLPLRDGIAEVSVWLGLLEVLLVQALPGLFTGLAAVPAVRRAVPAALTGLNLVLLMMRLGLLLGMARAYARRPWSYWFSPLMDLPVALMLIRSALQPEHRWRGRSLIRGAVG
jgi:dolichol-phosphate mannosyltransferase